MKTAYVVIAGFIVMIGIVVFFVAAKTVDAPMIDTPPTVIKQPVSTSTAPDQDEVVEADQADADEPASLPPGFTATPPSLSDSLEETVADGLIGLTLAEGQTYSADQGLMFRVGMIDGEPQMVTMDYRPGRITASIVDGVIVDYTVE